MGMLLLLQVIGQKPKFKKNKTWTNINLIGDRLSHFDSCPAKNCREIISIWRSGRTDRHFHPNSCTVTIVQLKWLVQTDQNLWSAATNNRPNNLFCFVLMGYKPKGCKTTFFHFTWAQRLPAFDWHVVICPLSLSTQRSVQDDKRKPRKEE